MEVGKLLKLSVILVALTNSACGERPYSIYETIGDSQSDGAVSRGWIPSWLPQNATGIHEIHDLDNAHRAISFQVSSIEEFQWPNTCVSVDEVTKPILTTKLFTRTTHLKSNPMLCGDLFVVKDGVYIHAWTQK